MSTYKEVYVGVYVECKNELKEKLETIKRCTNLQCATIYKDENIKFCGLCGSPVVNEMRNTGEYINKISSIDVPNELVDTLTEIYAYSPSNKDIYVSNTGIGKIEYEESGDRNIFELYDFNKENNLLLKINDTFRAFITDPDCMKFCNLLKKEYGEENVTIKFGTIVYWY